MEIIFYFKQNNIRNLWKWLLLMEFVMIIMLNIRNQKIFKFQFMGFFVQFLCVYKILFLNNFFIFNIIDDDFVLVVYMQKIGKLWWVFLLLIILYNIIYQDIIVERLIYLLWVCFGVKLNCFQVLYILIYIYFR